jgi:hypothetical protein
MTMRMSVMLYCPKCKKGYGKGEKVCPDCGETLKPKSKTAKSNEKEAFLISVSEGFDADMVEGSLRSAKIPYVKKGHSGSGGFARYDTKYDSLGADFYVPTELLSNAVSILPPVQGAQELQDAQQGKDEQGAGASDSTGIEKREQPPESSLAKRILETVLFLLAVVAVVFAVDTVMNIIRRLMGY